ncbi:MAG TPA: TetR/AcrR family transcriptional regulator [Steroidobacteraceae bacterium]|nr:TetR/AcrR family transcriptional regulator [Steroidobacteraceae bacterium]
MTKSRILEAAKTVLDREGLPALTIRKVAARAGLSPMAMYRHFADKGALLNALMQDGLAAWEEIARSLTARDPLQWLEQLMEAYVDFALRQPHRFDAAFFLPASGVRQCPGDFVAERSPVVAMALVRIGEAKGEGQLGERPALEVALLLFALAQGFVSMYRANRFASEKEFRTLYRGAIRHGIASFSVDRINP